MNINNVDQYFSNLDNRRKEIIDCDKRTNKIIGPYTARRLDLQYFPYHVDLEENGFLEDCIMKIIPNMTNDYSKNVDLIENVFHGLDYTDINGGSILHIIPTYAFRDFDEFQYFRAVDSLICTFSIDPNALDNFGNNTIQALVDECWWSEKVITDIITSAYEYGLDINHVNCYEHTIMHSAIYGSCDNVIHVYKRLIERGFDSTKKDCDERSIVDAMMLMRLEYQNSRKEKRVVLDGYPYAEEQIKMLENLYLKSCKSISSLSSLENEKEKQYSLKGRRKR